MTIRVLEPGLLTTVQDRGRWGSQSLGVPVAGPMDDFSHQLANLAVGNPAECATLEVTLAGPTLEFRDDIRFAVTGAEFELYLDDVVVPMGVACPARLGSVLRFGPRGAGARAYIGVAGGIDVPPVLGSRSTDLASGFGGLGGRRLQAGDRLVLGPMARGTARRVAPIEPLPLPDGGARVRTIATPLTEDDGARCGEAARAGLMTTQFTVAADSNRMGYRLSGPPLALADETSMLSAATPCGTVQVPPSGHPILLMADRQTTGGYPRVATVISADLSLVGQLAPGDWIRFEACDRGSAVGALIAQQQRLMRCTEWRTS